MVIVTHDAELAGYAIAASTPRRASVRGKLVMPYTPIIGTLGYVLSPDRQRVLMVHRIGREDDYHMGKFNGLGGKLESNEDILSGMKREIRDGSWH